MFDSFFQERTFAGSQLCELIFLLPLLHTMIMIIPCSRTQLRPSWWVLPVTCYLSSSRKVGHKTYTLCLNSALSLAAARTSFHVLDPPACLSFSTVRLHVIFDLACILLAQMRHAFSSFSSSENHHLSEVL